MNRDDCSDAASDKATCRLRAGIEALIEGKRQLRLISGRTLDAPTWVPQGRNNVVVAACDGLTGADVVVKISPRGPGLINQEAITLAFLQRQAVSVPAYLGTELLCLDGHTYRCLVMSRVQGRIVGSPADLAALGQALRDLHGLEGLPAEVAPAAPWAARHCQHTAQLRDVISPGLFTELKRITFAGLATGFTHGDAGPDNALIGHHVLTLLDFERAGPGIPLFDLAGAAIRAVLAGLGTLTEVTDSLTGGYGYNHNHHADAWRAALVAVAAELIVWRRMRRHSANVPTWREPLTLLKEAASY